MDTEIRSRGYVYRVICDKRSERTASKRSPLEERSAGILNQYLLFVKRCNGAISQVLPYFLVLLTLTNGQETHWVSHSSFLSISNAVVALHKKITYAYHN